MEELFWGGKGKRKKWVRDFPASLCEQQVTNRCSALDAFSWGCTSAGRASTTGHQRPGAPSLPPALQRHFQSLFLEGLLWIEPSLRLQGLAPKPPFFKSVWFIIVELNINLSTFHKSFPLPPALAVPSLFKLVFPFEAVLSHIEMFCDLKEVSSQEGSVSCAVTMNPVVYSIMECQEHSLHAATPGCSNR